MKQIISSTKSKSICFIHFIWLYDSSIHSNTKMIDKKIKIVGKYIRNGIFYFLTPLRVVYFAKFNNTFYDEIFFL
jgi:hypothetical protein